jgi:hypothetical protein
MSALVNGPITEYVHGDCHNTLPWLISFSIDGLMAETLRAVLRAVPINVIPKRWQTLILS